MFTAFERLVAVRYLRAKKQEGVHFGYRLDHGYWDHAGCWCPDCRYVCDEWLPA